MTAVMAAAVSVVVARFAPAGSAWSIAALSAMERSVVTTAAVASAVFVPKAKAASRDSAKRGACPAALASNVGMMVVVEAVRCLRLRQ